MAKRDVPHDVIRPLTIAVVVIMIVAVASLQLIKRMGGVDVESDPLMEGDSLDEIIEQFLPPEGAFDSIFGENIGSDEMKSTAVNIFARDSDFIEALVSKPEGNGPFPAIVLIHGEQSSKRVTEQISEDIGERLSASLGAVVVSVDWRDSDFGEEDLTDVLSTYDWIQDTTQTTGQPVVFFGVDHGAYLAARAAEELSVDGVVFAYGYAQPLAQYTFLQEKDEKSAASYIRQTGCDTVVEIDVCLEKLSITKGEIGQDMLVVHNVQDAIVPVAQAELLYAAIPEEKRTEIRLDNAELPHDLFSTHSDDSTAVLTQIETWISERLSPVVTNDSL